MLLMSYDLRKEIRSWLEDYDAIREWELDDYICFLEDAQELLWRVVEEVY